MKNTLVMTSLVFLAACGRSTQSSTVKSSSDSQANLVTACQEEIVKGPGALHAALDAKDTATAQDHVRTMYNIIEVIAPNGNLYDAALTEQICASNEAACKNMIASKAEVDRLYFGFVYSGMMTDIQIRLAVDSIYSKSMQP